MPRGLDTLQEWVDDCSGLVFFSGMGVSLESGVPDFRRMEEGHMAAYDYPPEALLSRPVYERRPAAFFRFYRDRILAPLLTAVPNATHHKLAEIERAGKLRRILTANMDDLHQEAGSRKVTELYGSVMRNHCRYCEQRYSALDIYDMPGIPYCDVHMCGMVIGPDIHLYGDPLDPDMLTEAIFQLLSCDLLIVAGTGLREYPAAAIVNLYQGRRMVLLNPAPTELDSRANLVLHGPIHETMGALRIRPKEGAEG